MARLLSAVPASTVSTASVEIPDDLRAELVEQYRFLKENPHMRGTATFDEPAELALFEKQARAWATANDVEYRAVRGTRGDTSVSYYLRDRVTPEAKEAAKAEQEAKAAQRAAEGKAKPGRKPKAK